ncbi:inter-alpha-trypsin inhibitor heavy chain H4-like isoform X2 [Patiria miniata]|uniref:Inter-alpha-trypsin inhibitor heavy chain H4 n=1 Tax=Patiria miniata TaxID=46514 RepID=A0A913ZU04_PATMI|nr:inter-alpha-trypsin inhibitor heavy chain H4-like isoform X2 [Patiria miniata]
MMRDLLLLMILAATFWCNDAAPHRAIKTPSFIASLDKASQRAKRESPIMPVIVDPWKVFFTTTTSTKTTQTTVNPDVIVPDPDPKPLKIRGLRVLSLVTARFTKTVVESFVVNPAEMSQEINFYMELPKEAFISGFLIETDGVVYNSRVDEKEAAQQAYDQAKSQGQTTGQVKQTSEEKNDFTISINVEAGSELRFNLTYEELLKRKDGFFENVISITPGQTVDHLIVDVHITEPQGIKEESVDFFVKKRLTDGSTEVQRPEWARLKGQHSDRVSVQFHPTPEEQEALSTNGNFGKFVVRYDVVHGQNAGNIEIVNGYFVHHFSPEGGFLPIQKSVVFVLDTSGSMSGTKIRQTKEAMDTILSDLREKDEFGIITFSSSTRAWRSRMVPANKANIESAKDEIQGLQARGGTNLHGGIVDAIEMLEDAQNNDLSTVGKFYLIIVLTDGMPTAGELTRPDEIKRDIRRRLDGRFSLFCLGFGDNLDYTFLEQLSLQNKGLARKIYEDSDAGLQLVGFFDEVATPLLVNIRMKYDENMVISNSVSDTVFPTYFEGTELVVAGQLAANYSLPERVICTVLVESGGIEIELELEANVQEESVLSPHTVDDFAQRLWAFLTIKELLQKRIAEERDSEKAELTQRALELSLKYHFVTPLTSLVVVKPDEDDALIGEPQPRMEDDAFEDMMMHKPVSRKQRPPSQPNRQRSGSVGPIGPIGPIAPQGSSILASPMHPPPSGPAPTSLHKAPTKAPTTTTTVATTTLATTAPTPTTPMGPPRKYRATFVMPMEGNGALCFNLRARHGQLYKLIDDQVAGLTVSGRMASAYLTNHLPNGNETLPLVLDRVTFQDGSLEVSPDGISIGPTVTLPWTGGWTVTVQGLKVSVRAGQQLTVRVGSDITLVIQKRVGNSLEHKRDFLGFEIKNGQGLSDQVDGIIGQFERREIRLDADSVSGEGDRRRGSLTVAGQRLDVRISERMDLREDRARECWWHAESNNILENPLRHYRT